MEPVVHVFWRIDTALPFQKLRSPSVVETCRRYCRAWSRAPRFDVFCKASRPAVCSRIVERDRGAVKVLTVPPATAPATKGTAGAYQGSAMALCAGVAVQHQGEALPALRVLSGSSAAQHFL